MKSLKLKTDESSKSTALLNRLRISVTIINGREGRALKRRRNKAVGSLQHKISKCKPGSKRHRKLVSAKKQCVYLIWGLPQSPRTHSLRHAGE